MRSLVASSDAMAQAGKVFFELEHARAKEGVARSALNRRYRGLMDSNPRVPPCDGNRCLILSFTHQWTPVFTPAGYGQPRASPCHSEIERLELERQVRALRLQVSRLSASLEGEQDRAR
jgi:hypothetical protein